MNKTDNILMLFPGVDAEEDKRERKSVNQIVEELRNRGINAEVCKRV